MQKKKSRGNCEEDEYLDRRRDGPVLANPLFLTSNRMLTLTYSLPVISKRVAFLTFPSCSTNVVVCAAKGPRPRYPRVWKTNRRIGTISKSVKLVECIKGLSNVKEEIYGALDSFIAWELEFPLITVKKALKTLEIQKEWKRIIQVAKWMLSKGQGRTMGTYFTLLNALAEDGRLDEAEELWSNLFSEHLESMPRIFFNKMITIYYNGRMYEKLFEVFADMEELGIRPDMATVTMIGNVFQELGMLDKYAKLKKKYPPPKWEYRYIKGKRIRIRSTHLNNANNYKQPLSNQEETDPSSIEMLVGGETNSDEETNPNLIEILEEGETISDEPEEVVAIEDQMDEQMHVKLSNEELIAQKRYSA